MPAATRISVIIPYFQRKPGLLRIALASIFEQVLADDVNVEVLIVDDASPTPPELETAGLSRPGFAIRIVKRPNGGPARARNTGLDEAAEADFVAFLDSDDVWSPGHLQTGLTALKAGAQFYFANNIYDGDHTWFSGFTCIDTLLPASIEGPPGVFSLSGVALKPCMLKGCLAHTSTVIYDRRIAPDLRFDDAQELAGEDHLFWIAAVDKAQRAAFSLKPTATRGRGVDLYRSALDWNDPSCVRRLYFKLMLHRKILANFCDTEEEKAVQRHRIHQVRRGIVYLFMRNALAHPDANTWVMRRLARTDPAFWPTLPVNAAIAVTQKLGGQLDFPVG